MVKIDLNRVSIVGLLLGVLAIVLAVIDASMEEALTMGSLLGSGVPYERVSVWMIIAVLAALVYIAGRIAWIYRHHFRRPPPGGSRR